MIAIMLAIQSYYHLKLNNNRVQQILAGISSFFPKPLQLVFDQIIISLSAEPVC